MSDMYNIILCISISILIFNFIIFYKDNYNLSKNKYIKALQILTPIWIILSVFTLFYTGILIYNTDIVSSIKDKSKNISNNINIGYNIEVDREVVKKLGRNLSIIGFFITIIKIIFKSTIPLLQRVGILTTSGILGRGIYLVSINLNIILNKSNINKELIISTYELEKFEIKSKSIFKLMDKSVFYSSTQKNSELTNIMLGLDLITYSCLMMIILLSFMLFFKFYLNESNVKFGNYLGEKANTYFIKLIKANKKTSNIYILLVILLLLIGIGYDRYIIIELYNNLDIFIYFHKSK